MRSVKIPNSSLEVSPFCLGTGNFGASVDRDAAFALLDAFAALGGTFIDTAHVYCDWIPGTKSASEKIIGQWLTTRGMHGKIVIGTKGAHPDLKTMHISRLSREDIAQDTDESLEYLQTDRIDLYWLHRDDPQMPVGAILDTLNEQVAQGKIRHFGASNWTIARIAAAADYAAAHQVQTFVANQPLWGLTFSNVDNIPDKTIVALNDDGVAYHRRTGLALIPYSSQGHGFFGKLASVGRAGISKGDLAQFDSPVNERRLPVVSRLAASYGVTLNDIVLAYLYSQPFPVIPIIGSKKIEQLRATAETVELRLTPEEVAALENA
jgi:aryl-alcohol dehydrogenase-like predicted oxidoreductase